MIKQYKSDKYKKIIGVDEVGRGCLAGPVVAAAVLLPDNYTHPKLNDSKKLSKKVREEVYKDIISNAIDYSISVVRPSVIDDINILEATMLAMNNALNSMDIDKDCLIIVDGNIFRSNNYKNYQTVVSGDKKYLEIAAASVLAKVHRDYIMERYHDYFPEYNWISNKGYGGKKHRDAIKQFGYCPLHRKSFNPLKSLLKEGSVTEYRV